MKTPIELAAEHARVYVANRGWRVEPLTGEEVQLLLQNQKVPHSIYLCDCEDAL